MPTTNYYEFGFKNKLWDKTPFTNSKQNPIKGYRKTLACCDNRNNAPIFIQINKDNYSKCSDNNICDRSGRTNKPIIRSGMQPKKQKRSSVADLLTLKAAITTAETAKTEADTLANKVLLETATNNYNFANQLVYTPYSYSYRDYMKNKKNITYERKQTTFNKVAGKKSEWTSGTGNCDENCNNKTTWKPSNDKFKVQGAVSSSSRLDRLKYDTIRGESKCKDKIKCNGVYFAGKPRFTGWIFNKNHKEICCPQEKAIRRTQFMRKDNTKYNEKLKHPFIVMTQINRQKTCCLSKEKKK